MWGSSRYLPRERSALEKVLSPASSRFHFLCAPSCLSTDTHLLMQVMTLLFPEPGSIPGSHHMRQASLPSFLQHVISEFWGSFPLSSHPCFSSCEDAPRPHTPSAGCSGSLLSVLTPSPQPRLPRLYANHSHIHSPSSYIPVRFIQTPTCHGTWWLKVLSRLTLNFFLILISCSSVS